MAMRRIAQLGRKNLLIAILLVCVLCVVTIAANSHIHSPSDRTPESHCSLCVLAATLTAVVVSMVLIFSAKLSIRIEPAAPRLPAQFRVTRHSIRPPPRPAL